MRSEGGWRITMLFLLFSVLFPCTQNCFLNAPLSSTFALSASSCIPVGRWSLRGCAKPQAGVSPPRRSPLCILVGYTSTSFFVCFSDLVVFPQYDQPGVERDVHQTLSALYSPGYNLLVKPIALPGFTSVFCARIAQIVVYCRYIRTRSLVRLRTYMHTTDCSCLFAIRHIVHNTPFHRFHVALLEKINSGGALNTPQPG